MFSRVSGQVYAVDGVSLHIDRGETLGLVGRERLRQVDGRPDAPASCSSRPRGTIRVAARTSPISTPAQMLPYRRQHADDLPGPYASLNPRMSAGDIVGEPLIIHGVGSAQGAPRARRDPVRAGRAAARADGAAIRTNSPAASASASASRARWRLSPELIVGDEPVSALDVSIQAQIINLLMDLQDEYQLSYLFVAHDLAVVEHISDRVAVMYLGRIVEMTDKTSLFETPLHPYTEALLSAVPIPKSGSRGRKRLILNGDVPARSTRLPGCHFHTRCPYAMRAAAPRHRRCGR